MLKAKVFLQVHSRVLCSLVPSPTPPSYVSPFVELIVDYLQYETGRTPVS